MFKELIIHSAAILGVWFTLVAAGFGCRFVFSYSISLSWIIRFVSFGCLGLLSIIILTMFLPALITVPLLQIVFPRFLCAVAFHVLLILGYQRAREHQYTVSFFRVTIMILLGYVFALVSAGVVLRINNSFFVDISNYSTNYLISSFLVVMLIVLLYPYKQLPDLSHNEDYPFDQPPESDDDPLGKRDNFNFWKSKNDH